MSNTSLPDPEQPTAAMRWAGIIITPLVTLALVLIAYITKNPYYLAPTVPLGFVWHTLAKFLYMRPADYKLAELKATLKAGKQSNKKRIAP